MPAGGLYLGAGARDPVTGGWSGVIDEVRFAATAFSPARIASRGPQSEAPPRPCTGSAARMRPGRSTPLRLRFRSRSPRATGSSIDIDVAASAYDPDGPGLPEIVGSRRTRRMAW